jgi:hypothetical protein
LFVLQDLFGSVSKHANPTAHEVGRQRRQTVIPALCPTTLAISSRTQMAPVTTKIMRLRQIPEIPATPGAGLTIPIYV